MRTAQDTGTEDLSEADAGRRGALGTWWRSGNRTLPLLGAVAVVSLVAGLGLSRLVINPADAAARTAPPAAGPITVPVESRELSNDVTIRGDVVFDGAAEVRVETADLGERAVVTGQVPEVGATFDPGSVALEIAGRPVIVLPGALPTYRTLRVGVSGPDVLQLKAALGALGIGAGDPASDDYDAATAAGVAALYQRVGYPVAPASDEETEAVDAAEQAVRSAQAEVAASEGALSGAGRGGTTNAQVAEADAAVRAAQRAREVAEAALADLQAGCGTGVVTECGSAAFAAARNAVADAADQVGVAAAARAQLDAAPDTSAERAAVTAARQALADARTTLTEAQQQTLTTLPASEVVYLETLPRRVDSVDVRRGGTVDGPVMSVSGATLQVEASAARADAALLTVGATGTVVAGDLEVPVTVTEIRAAGDAAGSGGSGDSGEGDGEGDGASGDGESSAGRSTIVLVPGELPPEQVAALQGSNVRVTIPVSSTGGAVLAVPLAALTAGPGGESRVEVMDDDGTTALVEVTTGLAADGYVEVTGVERGLSEGELVVIGEVGSGDEATAAPTSGADG
ncbi:hypothetical protein [Cellulomonas endometrii]|uniref:hypothetical protein n=1 Tax=Cellulomonas endometrii TaxID=3036301 RepID=UPI0024ACBEA0|nr:hypothetical protein [Cellulomonas endometrii]